MAQSSPQANSVIKFNEISTPLVLMFVCKSKRYHQGVQLNRMYVSSAISKYVQNASSKWTGNAPTCIDGYRLIIFNF